MATTLMSGRSSAAVDLPMKRSICCRRVRRCASHRAEYLHLLNASHLPRLQMQVTSQDCSMQVTSQDCSMQVTSQDNWHSSILYTRMLKTLKSVVRNISISAGSRMLLNATLKTVDWNTGSRMMLNATLGTVYILLDCVSGHRSGSTLMMRIQAPM